MIASIARLKDYVEQEMEDGIAKKLIWKQMILLATSTSFLTNKVSYATEQYGVTTLSKRAESCKCTAANLNYKIKIKLSKQTRSNYLSLDNNIPSFIVYHSR